MFWLRREKWEEPLLSRRETQKTARPEHAMSPSNRRQFLTRAAALSCGALCNNMLMAHPHQAAAAPLPTNGQLSGKSLLAKMKWFNEPASLKQIGDQLVVTTKSKTDFWRKTFYDYVTNDGHFFFLPVTSDFTWESRVTGKYPALYD
jgi:uncharacterized protein DUF1349